MLKRLENFSHSANLKFHTKWLAHTSNKKLIIRKKLLENIGNNRLGGGTNCSEYNKKDKMLVKNHTDYQIKLFKKLTNLKEESLNFPNICGLYGKFVDENTIIPPTAPRCGYYMYQIEKYIKKLNIQKNKYTILEIGGGWGYLSYIIKNKIKNSSYIIVDIPQAIINIAYILTKCGKNVILENEINNINETIQDNSIDVILVSPSYIENIDKVDIVISTACLPELPKDTINYYLNFIKEKCQEFCYIDYTDACNGEYIDECLSNMDIIMKQKTPINCYMCPENGWFMGKNYGKNEIIKEMVINCKNL
jgi:hypothetical protein